MNKNLKWSRYRPGVAQRAGRSIALLFHNRGTRREWVVSSTPRPHFTPGKDPVPILQEAGWAPGSVWKRFFARGPSSSVTIPTDLLCPQTNNRWCNMSEQRLGQIAYREKTCDKYWISGLGRPRACFDVFGKVFSVVFSPCHRLEQIYRRIVCNLLCRAT